MSRMKYIERWSLMRNTLKENIMEHSEQVAQIAHALAVIKNRLYGGKADVLKVISIAVYHEASEVITGDLPTPIKYFNPDIKTAYKSLEKVANEKFLLMIPEEIREDYENILNPDTKSEEYRIVKEADKLSAYIKCIDENRSGNSEFIKAEAIIREELLKNDSPELKYFMENFIPSFRKSLDEMGKK
jgi:5'-deoxynucleotidase